MLPINVLTIQRISAQDRAKIEAVDPAIRLTDAGGWFDGEIRETWPAFTVGALSGAERDRQRHARRTRPPAGRGRNHPWRLAVSARSAGALAAAEMVPSAPGRREQPAARRSVGQRRDRHDVARRRQYAGDGGIRGGRHPALRQGPASRRRRSRGRRVRSSRLSAAAAAGQDRLRRRRRRHRAARSAGCAPRSACASSARGASRSRTRRCRPGSAELGGAGDLDRLSAGERFRGDLLPMDAGDDRPVQRRPLCRDEAGQRAGQRRARRDRRRGGAGRRAGARSSARRGAGCLCRRVRAPAAGAAMVRTRAC